MTANGNHEAVRLFFVEVARQPPEAAGIPQHGFGVDDTEPPQARHIVAWEIGIGQNKVDVVAVLSVLAFDNVDVIKGLIAVQSAQPGEERPERTTYAVEVGGEVIGTERQSIHDAVEAEQGKA